MKKLITIALLAMFMVSCASTQKGFDYKAHQKKNLKLQKRGYQPCKNANKQ